jgi:diguanylate cyclase (GGDEF)-like protein/PAS domain S-box-containing protein
MKFTEVHKLIRKIAKHQAFIIVFFLCLTDKCYVYASSGGAGGAVPIVASAAFVMLALLVFILAAYARKLARIKHELSDSHEELTQLYEELTASDEELRQQYDELNTIKENLAASEDRFRVATDGSNAIIWDVDMSNMHYEFSNRLYELLGYEKGELDEANGGWRSIIHPDDALSADKARNDHLDGKTPFYNTEYRMRRKDGGYIWFNIRGKALKDGNGKNIRFAGSLIDISERKDYETRLKDSYRELESANKELKEAQEELRKRYDEILMNHRQIKQSEDRLAYLAYHDTLTGLPNKQALYEYAGGDFLNCSGGNNALLFIDMDNFKYINDTMGHASGDSLIRKVSERLAALMKDRCSLYRLSGDEFVIIIHNIDGMDDAEVFASHILAGFKEKFLLNESVLYVSLSIGIAIQPEHGRNIEELLKNADIAMYKAKETGRDRYIVYDTLMNKIFTERAKLEKNLYSALGNNEFELYYQPQLDLELNRITGFEALLRWRNPELGTISPLKFIPVAEDTHLIIPLGYWVLRSACAFLKELHEKGYDDLTISVNISVIQLLQTDFSIVVTDILEFYGMDPGFLELEITETVLMESFEELTSKLVRLREKGVRIALDDFGKGYSSLSYLKQLPISTLKIDKTFIDGISDDYDTSLTGHIISIGKCMGMCVIAEGVEKQEQLHYLIRHECRKIQGFFFSRPVPGEEAKKLLVAFNKDYVNSISGGE